MNSKVKEKQWITNEAFFPLWFYKTALGTIPPDHAYHPETCSFLTLYKRKTELKMCKIFTRIIQK